MRFRRGFATLFSRLYVPDSVEPKYVAIKRNVDSLIVFLNWRREFSQLPQVGCSLILFGAHVRDDDHIRVLRLSGFSELRSVFGRLSLWLTLTQSFNLICADFQRYSAVWGCTILSYLYLYGLFDMKGAEFAAVIRWTSCSRYYLTNAISLLWFLAYTASVQADYLFPTGSALQVYELEYS